MDQDFVQAVLLPCCVMQISNISSQNPHFLLEMGRVALTFRDIDFNTSMSGGSDPQILAVGATCLWAGSTGPRTGPEVSTLG